MTRFRDDSDAAVRKAALNGLVNLVGPTDQPAVAPLCTALKNTDPEIVRAAALALANIGGAESKPAVPILCSALRDRDVEARRIAAAALSNIGPHAADGVASLTKTLSDRDALVRRNAALALGKIGKSAGAAAAALGEIVDSNEERQEVRIYATEALGQISPAIEPAVPKLMHVLQSKAPWQVRQRAIWALAKIDHPENFGVFPALESLLAESDRESRLVRYDSAIILGAFQGPQTSDRTIDLLEAMLLDKDVGVYSGSDAKVSTTGGESRGGETTVTKVVSADSRGMAAVALARIGPRANRPEIVKALKEATQSTEPRVRDAAAKALKSILGN